MTIIAPAPRTQQHTPSEPFTLTPFDALDVECALKNAAAADCTELNAADRQALALLTYWDDLSNLHRLLVTRILDGGLSLPLNERAADAILALATQLPAVTEQDVDAWLAARDIETPCVIDRIIAALAMEAATRIGTPAGYILYGAVQTVIRIGKPGVALYTVPDIARYEIDAAHAGLDAEGLIPNRQPDPVEQVLETVASYAARYSCDIGGGHTTTILRAVILAARFGAAPGEAIERARLGGDDEVRAAGRDADDMVARISRAALTAIDDADEDLAVAL